MEFYEIYLPVKTWKNSLGLINYLSDQGHDVRLGGNAPASINGFDVTESDYASLVMNDLVSGWLLSEDPRHDI